MNEITQLPISKQKRFYSHGEPEQYVAKRNLFQSRMREFSRDIKAKREERKISLETLGDIVGTTAASICRYERFESRGKVSMNSDIFLNLCRELGLNPLDYQPIYLRTV